MREATDAARFPLPLRQGHCNPGWRPYHTRMFPERLSYRSGYMACLYKPTRTDEKAVGVMVQGPFRTAKMQRSLPLLALCGTLALALPSAGLALVDKDASAQSASFKALGFDVFHPGFGRSEAGRPRR